MKHLYHLGMLNKGFLAYSSPVMLISKKVTHDRRVVTDFRHLNVRIAKNNIACPLLKDTFSGSGSSRCEVLLVLDLKNAWLGLPENSRRYCGILLYFGSTSYLYQRMPMGLNISPWIWQSYINAILVSTEQKIMQSDHGWLIAIYPIEEITYSKIRSINSFIQRKVFKGMLLPVGIKEIQAGYLVRPYCKDMYLYLAQKMLPSTKAATWKVETLAKIYITRFIVI